MQTFSKITAGFTIAFASLLSFTQTANAAIYSTFTNSSDFLNATGSSLSTEDFEDVGATNISSFDSSNPNLASGITFSAGSSGFTDSNLSYFDDNLGFSQIQTIQLFDSTFASNAVRLDFSPSVTALGFDLTSWSTETGVNNNSVEIIDNLGNSDSFTVDTTTGNPAFFGILAISGSITQATLTPGDQTVGIDNISFGQASASVPFEFSPALGLILVGLGFSGLKLRQAKLAKKDLS